LKQFVIRHADKPDHFWSLYGWAPLLNALRFSSEADAQGFRRDHGLAGPGPAGAATIHGIAFDDERRPDVQTDYNPFAV
jgi:hypothetical protein